jgi:thiamine biosynthesis lipoprotein ApbE
VNKRLLVLFALALALTGRTPLTFYTFHHENVLGTSLELKFEASSQESADAAEAAALAEIDREAEILSSYSPSSEFSRWFRTSGQPVHVSAELFEVLNLFDQWKQRSNGALDASAEAVVRLWKQGRVPTEAELAAATAAVRQKHWSLDASAQTATHLDNTPLALNSFTKSYIVSRAADAALATGVRSAVVNIGGDLVIRGANAESVIIADPRADSENDAPLATLLVHDRAIATSGDYRRGFDIGGQHYSHIVDPRTGQPAGGVISSTVIANDASEAGALATAFSVLKPEQSAKLAATRPGVEYMLIAANGAHFESAGWRSLLLAAPQGKPAAPADLGELTVNLELSRIDGQRVRRPYVAVWIEDKDNFPLRTVALWFEKPRWLPELKAWTRADRLRAMAEGNDITASVSSATRPPGKYTFKWDGKDQQGKAVKPGKYTVMIEVAREHGTYQLMKQEMDFNGVPKQVELPANTEVAAASLDYRKR